MRIGLTVTEVVDHINSSLRACLHTCIPLKRSGSAFAPPMSSKRSIKEFKRRTKPMEIVAGEKPCYTLLAFICLKMERTWRSKPIGKVVTNPPFLKRLAEETFTKER